MDRTEEKSRPSPDPFGEEQLRYLLAFSGGLLDLLPDGTAVLDDRLRVRSANRSFRESFALPPPEEEPLLTLDHPLLDVPAGDEEDGRSLREELLALLDGPDPDRPRLFTVSLDAAGGPRRWTVRARAWDRDDPAGRRLLLWVREERRGEPPVEAVLLGASERDLSLIDLLHRAPRVRLLRVWDPDPDAAGLSFAAERGIAASGGGDPLSEGEGTPEVFLIARDEVREELRGRPAEGAAVVRPEDLDSFLRDPDRHVRGDAGKEEEEREGEGGGRRDEGIGGEVERILEALDLLLDFSSLSDWVLARSLELSRGKTGSLMILEEGGALRIVASRGIPDGVARATRMRLGEGIAGRVAETGEPLLLVGRVGDERFQGVGGRPSIGSSMSVPIRSGGEILGVLNVNAGPEERDFGDRELRQVEALAMQIGRALHRSLDLRGMRRRSFEQSIRSRMDAIAAGSSDLGSKLKGIAGHLADRLDADLCAIYLLDPEREELELRAAAGPSAGGPGAVRVRIGRGLVGRVARSRAPIRMRNEADGEPGEWIEIAAPILHGTELIGVLLLEADLPGGGEEEGGERILSALHAGAARIGEICGYERSTRRATFLSALSEMGTAFTAASDRTALAKLIAFTAATVLESDVATVRILREDAEPEGADSERMELLAVHGASAPAGDHPLGILDELAAAKASVAGRPVRETGGDPEAEISLRKRANVSGFLALPILSGRDRVGVVTVYRVTGPGEEPAGYGEHETEAGMRLVDYAAAAAIRFLGGGEEERDPGGTGS